MNPDPGQQSNPMPMVATLKRWRGWPRPQRSSHRWRRAERFRTGRTDDRLRPVGTILRRDGRAAYLVSHHQTLRPYTYAPQFQLAIHPPGHQMHLPSHQRHTETVRTRTRLILAAHATTEPERSNRGTLPRIPRESRLLTGMTPRRSQKAQEPASHDITESVIERVIRSHQRIESRQRTSVVIREQPKLAVEIERALTSISKRPAESSMEPTSPMMGWPANSSFMTPNGPDLERLTDQIVRRIDDRLTAQRERMGRW